MFHCGDGEFRLQGQWCITPHFSDFNKKLCKPLLFSFYLPACTAVFWSVKKTTGCPLSFSSRTFGFWPGDPAVWYSLNERGSEMLMRHHRLSSDGMNFMRFFVGRSDGPEPSSSLKTAQSELDLAGFLWVFCWVISLKVSCQWELLFGEKTRHPKEETARVVMVKCSLLVHGSRAHSLFVQ
ncbi:hypothetical protein ATANTOWER_007494 [Ataeniobius toweri]|uniref:Uncharacterized protein n=1 Tax=Ataeniobius toweri TaxID=208326 RepID=A0ABU7BX91_9TELE|nr:hypothetical protein [Ataeniobius toweri]